MAHIYLNFSAKKARTQLFYLIYLVICAQLLSSLCILILHTLGLNLSQPSYAELSITIFLSQVFAFFAPACFWGFYYSPKSWWENLAISPLQAKDYRLLLVSLLAIPATAIFDTLNLALVFADFFPLSLRQQILASESRINQLILPLFTKLHPLNYLSTFLLIALLPAVCEELLFRGVLQKILIRLTGKISLGILLTALLFALFHGQFLGIIPRFFLGIVLGLLFYRSNTILVPMIFHLLFNGIEAIIVFLSNSKRLQVPENLPVEWDSWILGTLCLILFVWLWNHKITRL